MRIDAGEWHVSIEEPSFEFRDPTIKVYVWHDVDDRNAHVLQPDGSMVKLDYASCLDSATPTFVMPGGGMQAMLDALWERGFRPKSRRYEEETKLLREVMETQGRHLDDMRKLALPRDEEG